MSSRSGQIPWERAEIARSRAQAVRRPAIQPTPASVLRRYANPPADTRFPLEYVYHLIGDVRGQSILDFGCGDGCNIALLATRGCRVYALDVSPDLLAQAARRAIEDGVRESVHVLCGSAHAVPLPDGSVDLVVGNVVLHHLDLAAASREVYRVLRPGGRAIFREPIRPSGLARALRPLVPYRQPDVSPYERPLVPSDIDTFSRPFQRLRRRDFMLPFVKLARIFGVSSSMDARILALDRRLLSSHSWLRTYATVTVFELRKPDPAVQCLQRS
jgi:SAM-dependent methyltransferase